MVGLQGHGEGEQRVENKGKTSNRCMTAVLRALVFFVLSVAVTASVCPGLSCSGAGGGGGGGYSQSQTVREQTEERDAE